MKSKYSELIKNTGILTIANFSSKILVFFLVPLYTSVLSTSEYGITDLIFSTVQLITPILTFNISDAVLRFTLENKKNNRDVFSISMKYTLRSLLPFSVLLFICYYYKLYDVGKIHWIYIVIYYISYALNQILPTYAKGIDKLKETAISGVLSTIANVFACIIFLLVLKKGIEGYFISNIFGQVVPVFYLLIKICCKQKNKVNKQDNAVLEKKMLRYSLPLILTNIGWWINNTSDRYIITYFYGVAVNGLLSVAYKIPSILSVISGVFIQAWQISAMKEYGKKDSKEFYRSIFMYLNLFLFSITYVLILAIKPLSHLIYKKEFYNAWIFIPFLLLSMVFNSNAGFFSPIITSSYNTRDVALSTIFGAVANVILNVLFLKIIGTQGVAVATAISGFIIMGYRYYVLHNIIDKSVFFRVGVLWLLLLVQCLFELKSIWFGELIIGCVAVVIFYADLKTLIDKIIKLLKERKNYDYE